MITFSSARHFTILLAAFVPMQVSRKIVRTKSQSEDRELTGEKPAAEARGAEQVQHWVDASADDQRKNGGPPPQRGRGGRGRGGTRGKNPRDGKPRKQRLAANFGGAQQ